MAEKKDGAPRHIAIIMDGNGRWAKRRLLPRAAGHRAGMNRMIGLAEHVFDRGAVYCTLFALSTENLSRPKEELDGLFALFREYFPANTARLKSRSIALNVIGDMSLLPEDIVSLIRKGEADTAGGARGTLLGALVHVPRRHVLRSAQSCGRGDACRIRQGARRCAWSAFCRQGGVGCAGR